MKVKSLSKCPTLHDPMDCSLPGSSIHGIFQARVLEWVAIAFSKNTLQGINSRLYNTEERSSNLEDRVVEVTQAEQKKKKGKKKQFLKNKDSLRPLRQYQMY